MLWSQHYASAAGLDEAVLALAVDAQGNAYGAGRANLAGTGSEMFCLKLAAATGDVIWSDTRGGAGLAEDAAWSVVVGPDGQPVIAGVVDNGGTSATVTRKLNAADGGLIWEREIPDAVAGIATPGQWLSVLDGGDIALCARDFGTSGYDVVLQRYAADSGATVWAIRYDGATGGGDDPLGLLRGADGDLIVFGVQDVWWNYDYMALKFAAADGSLVWEGERYDGPPGWYDVATCATVAPGGELVLGGLSDGTGTGWDIAAVGYDPLNGQIRWTHRYDGPASASDEARDVAAGADGTLFVTGYAYGTVTGKDQVVLRLDPALVSGVGDLPRSPGAEVRAWPNPFNPRVRLAYTLHHPGTVRLTVHDVRGALVTVLAEGSRSAGEHLESWNGLSSNGLRVSAGSYLVRLDSPDGTATRPITLLP